MGHSQGVGRGTGNGLWLPPPEAPPDPTSSRALLRHQVRARRTSRAQGLGQWGPNTSTGVLPTPQPGPPAVIPGVWAAGEPRVGASRPGDVPGDPSAASPYSLWVLRGSFAAVSLKGMEKREGYSAGSTTGPEVHLLLLLLGPSGAHKPTQNPNLC